MGNEVGKEVAQAFPGVEAVGLGVGVAALGAYAVYATVERASAGGVARTACARVSHEVTGTADGVVEVVLELNDATDPGVGPSGRAWGSVWGFDRGHGSVLLLGSAGLLQFGKGDRETKGVFRGGRMWKIWFLVCKSKRLVGCGWGKPEKVDRVVSIWDAKMRLFVA